MILSNLTRRLRSPVWLCLFLSAFVSGPAAGNSPFDDAATAHPVSASHGMVVAREETAARIGRDILAGGGNAVDAAVATGFALAVTLPQAGNLGGGGFMVIHLADGEQALALDYRETAPAKAHRDLFLDNDGAVDEYKSRYSHLATGTPGTVAGFAEVLQRHGTLTLAEVLEPAIALAENGFPVSPALASHLLIEKDKLSRSPDAKRTFFHPDGRTLEAGDRLRQPDLAESLRRIKVEGPDAFYRGSIAEKIVADMEAFGGLVSMEDLDAYRPVWRDPIKGEYRGHKILSMPPPSSGGVHLVQMLNILEEYPISEYGHNSARTIHLMAEAMKLAYADRSIHLGDPDFADIPVDGLTSKSYATQLRERVNPDMATPAGEIAPGNPRAFQEASETTHFSVVDRDGNAVSNTFTLNFRFGTGHIATGTGIFLNNQMDDFSAKPGVPNAYGLIGGEFNAIEPGKRMLSSMTPVIVLRDGAPYIVTGSPGGSRIINTSLQVLLNVIDHGRNIAEATHAPRVHHQWLPDELLLERGISPDTERLLSEMGHNVLRSTTIGAAQSILFDGQRLHGASDPRRPGGAAAGH